MLDSAAPEAHLAVRPCKLLISHMLIWLETHAAAMISLACPLHDHISLPMLPASRTMLRSATQLPFTVENMHSCIAPVAEDMLRWLPYDELLSVCCKERKDNLELVLPGSVFLHKGCPTR